MKLQVAGLVVTALLTFGTVGCGLGKGQQAKVPVGTTTLTNAPMTPDAPLPSALSAALWEEEDETPITPPVETWGVRAPTPEELSTYGF